MRQAICAAPLLLGFSSIGCAPDFASLSSGSPGGSGGTSSTMGSGGSFVSGGSLGAGEPSFSGSGGAASAAGAGGASGSSQTSGGTAGTTTSNAGASGEAVGAAGEAGSGTVAPCAFLHANARAFDVFNGGLGGPGFDVSTATSTNVSTHKGTSSAVWEGAVGLSCPGSWHLIGDFKGYSAEPTEEKVIGDIRFTTADWTGATALHAWVKVHPSTSPLQGVQLFAISDTSAFLYESVFDDAAFHNANWNEMILPLKKSATCNPAQVFRLGIELVLKAAGSEGNPTTPPVTEAWLDDIWVQ